MKRQLASSHPKIEWIENRKAYWELSGPSFAGTFATTDRGWLFAADGTPLGNFVDYGSDHYRSGHEYCREICACRNSSPGNIHAVLTPNNCTGESGVHFRYCATIAEAKAFIANGERYRAPINSTYRAGSAQSAHG